MRHRGPEIGSKRGHGSDWIGFIATMRRRFRFDWFRPPEIVSVNVRLWPKADVTDCAWGCLLLAQSRHPRRTLPMSASDSFD